MPRKTEWEQPSLLADIAGLSENLGLAERINLTVRERRNLTKEIIANLEEKKTEARNKNISLDKVTAMQKHGREAASRRAVPSIATMNNRLI